jgi:predicted nucleic acid-binding protein
VKLIDTSVVLDHLQGELKATALLSDLLARNEVVAASELTRAEVLAAIRPGERDASEQFFSVFSWVPVNEQISRVAGDLASDRPAGRHGVGAVDYLIAATAMVIGAELVTTNPRRFPMLSELKPAYTRR